MATESDKLSPKSAKGEFTGWSTLSERYDVGSTTDKFNCFVDAVSQAIEMVRVEGNDPRVLLELLLQLEDKRNGTNSSLLDFSAGKDQKEGRPAEFSSNLKKVNAAAAIDAFMALGFTPKEAAERAGQELLVSSDSVLRWRKRYSSEDVHLWSSEYHNKISALRLLEKNEIEKIIPIFLNAAR